ncbi:MAG: O-antigen ligase family protein [bacterium]|nr:O-antigen ligase family protein [bacterium]
MKTLVFLLILYLVVFTLGQLLRFTLGMTEINLHFADIAVGILVSFWLINKIIKKEKFVWPPLSKQIFLFFCLAAVSLAFNSTPLRSIFHNEMPLAGRELFVSWLYLFRWIFYAGLYFVVYDLVLIKKELVENIKKWLIWVGLGVAVFGLGQYVFLPDTRFLENFGWDPHYFRVIGTFFDPGFLGVILVLSLILLTLWLWKVKPNKLGILFWLIIYSALALTYSRASYLAYLLGMGTIAYFKKSPKFFVCIFAFLIVTILLLPRPGGEGVKLERESTIKYRIINWGQSLTIARDHPVFGVGFNAYRYSQRDYGFLDFANWRSSHAGGGADSSLLFVLATTGIFGLLAYLWLWWKIIITSLKRKDALILATVSALLIHSLFDNSLFYPWVMGWIWILLGAAGVKD